MDADVAFDTAGYVRLRQEFDDRSPFEARAASAARTPGGRVS